MKPNALISFLILLALLFSLSCKKSTNPADNQSPHAAFSFTPQTGDTTVLFLFDASSSSDPEQGTDSLLYSWDFTGDHQWSDYGAESIIHHQFHHAGTYQVSVEVKDKQGWTDTETHTLTVTN